MFNIIFMNYDDCLFFFIVDCWFNVIVVVKYYGKFLKDWLKIEVIKIYIVELVEEFGIVSFGVKEDFFFFLVRVEKG